MLTAARAATSSRAGCNPSFAPKDAAKMLLGISAPLPVADGRFVSFGVRLPGSQALQYAVMITCRGRHRCGSFSLFIDSGGAGTVIPAEEAFQIFGTAYSADFDPNIPALHRPAARSPGALGDVRFRLSPSGARKGSRCPRTVRASFDDHNNLFSITIISGE